MADVTNPATDVKIEDLPKYLGTVDSLEKLERLKAADARVTAGPLYDARIAELSQDTATEESKPKPSGKHARVAATRLKYDGTRYMPGDPVPFASAKDAEPYEAAGSLQAKK